MSLNRHSHRCGTTQDNVWLLPHFVARTIAFFATHDRDVLLSYPERRVAPPPGRLKRAWMNDTSGVSICTYVLVKQVNSIPAAFSAAGALRSSYISSGLIRLYI